MYDGDSQTKCINISYTYSTGAKIIMSFLKPNAYDVERINLICIILALILNLRNTHSDKYVIKMNEKITCKELAEMIVLEAKVLYENVSNVECQLEANKELVRCVTLRKLLIKLNKQLAKWSSEKYGE